MKLHFSHKIINKEVLKQAGNSGFYLYGNHTHFLADAMIPTLVNYPRETAVIVHPNNVSMPVLGRITPYLGALPLPDDRGAMKHFLEALTWHTDHGDCIMIYPEAHIWPAQGKVSHSAGRNVSGWAILSECRIACKTAKNAAEGSGV